MKMSVQKRKIKRDKSSEWDNKNKYKNKSTLRQERLYIHRFSKTEVIGFIIDGDAGLFAAV